MQRTYALGIVIFALFVTTGCPYSMTIDFPISQGQLTRYMECLKKPGGNCDPAVKSSPGYANFYELEANRKFLVIDRNVPQVMRAALKERGAIAAATVLDSQVEKELMKLYRYLRKGEAAGQDQIQVTETDGVKTSFYSITTTQKDLEEYQSALNASVQSGAWDALEDVANIYRTTLQIQYKELQDKGLLTANDEHQKELRLEMEHVQELQDIGVFVKAYLTAYFRHGKFAKIDIDPVHIETTLKDQILRRFPGLTDDQVKELIKRIFGNLPQAFFGEIESAGFVTRGGSTYQFPAIEAKFDPIAKRPLTISKVDFPTVASDLIRVSLEAVFDALEKLPAVSEASGVKEGLLKVNNPTDSRVNADEFGEISKVAGQAEAAASTTVGQFIRGAGWVSLNNEALAKVIETGIGVTIRKVVEKCVWCWYACKIDNAKIQMGSKEEMVLHLTVKGDRRIFSF